MILDGEINWGGKLAYHVFDIMWVDGRDVTILPIEERRALLKDLPLSAPLHRVVALDDELPWERAQKEGWEGVVAKRRGSIYEQRRSPHWLKMKCELAQEFVVGGFTDPQGKRVGLGALLVGYYEGDDFVFAGKIGTGFDTALLLKLRAQPEDKKTEKDIKSLEKKIREVRALNADQDALAELDAFLAHAADVAKIVSDFSKIAQQAGGGAGQQITPQQLSQLQGSIKDASVDVYSGKADHLLHKLSLALTITPPTGPSAPPVSEARTVGFANGILTNGDRRRPFYAHR